MKKILSVFSVLIIALFLSILFSNNIVAATPDACMIVTSPGQDSSVEMNIGWHTGLENTKSYVLYTKKSDTDWSEQKQVFGTYIKEDCFNGISSKNEKNENIYEDAIFLDYTAVLTDLEPDTEYMYKVGQNVLSEVQYFKTAGNTEFSFAWISDFHAYDPIPNRLKSAMNMIKTLDEYNKGFDFIFSTGDELAWGGSYLHWQDLFEQHYHKNYMWASTIGNHDYMDKTNTKNCNDFFRSAYAFPTNGYEGEEGVCYYFTYSNVLFITMNNETQTNSAEIKKAQDWFEEVVTKNPAQYIIVSQHYQWFSGETGSFNNSSGYGRWKELFDKYNVDLAISGNNHIYVRSKPLYEDKVSYDYKLGTTYIQTCSSDNERGSDMKELTSNKNIIAHRFTEGGNTVGGIVVNVNEERIKVELLNRKGELQDSVEIKARRDVYPMNDFNKENFEKDIQIVNSKSNDQAIINFNNNGIGYVDKIVVKKDNQVLAETKLKTELHTLLTINNLEKDTVNNLDIEITYKDKTTKNLTLKVNTKIVEGNISNCLVSIVSEGYKVKFDNTYTNLDEIKIYLNDTLVSTNNGNINEFIVKTEEKSVSDKIKIEGIVNNSVIKTKEFNYYSPIDYNCDGVEDKNDLLAFSNDILINETDNSIKNIHYYDFNNDGFVDVKDATYMAMYLDKVIEQPKLKKFTVTFLDGNGKVISTQYIDAFESAQIEDPTIDGYTFIGWDKDFTYITSDIVVKAIYSKN